MSITTRNNREAEYLGDSDNEHSLSADESNNSETTAALSEAARRSLSYFKIFCHTSWKDERLEDIEYSGERTWHVDSTLHLNLKRLASFMQSDNTEDESSTLVQIPLFELDKNERSSRIRVKNGAGANLKVSSDEGSFFFKWMVLMGCIANAYVAQIIPTYEIQPSKTLAELMDEEIARFSTPAYDGTFSDYFEKHLEEYAECNRQIDSDSLLKEWAFYKENIPGFASLFSLFSLRWVPTVFIDISDNANQVLNINFDEYYEYDPCESTISKNEFGIFSKTEKKLADSGYHLTCPLRRVHTAESERFWIHVPDWTFLLPCTEADIYHQSEESDDPQSIIQDSTSFCRFIDRCNAYEDENAMPIIAVDGKLDTDTLFLKTYARWNNNREETYRRFDIPETPAQAKQCSVTNWGEHVSKNIHSYAVEVKWAAKPMRRGRAMGAFLITSTIAVALLALIIPSGNLSLENSSNFSDSSGFLTALCVAVPLLALAFSNLQEEVTFFRAKLMKVPRSWVRCGIWCDCIAYIITFIASFFSSYAIVRWVNFIVLLVIAIILGKMAYNMWKWVNKHEFSGSKNKNKIESKVSSVAIHGVTPDNINPHHAGPMPEA